MADPALARMESLLRRQQQVLSELIEIALMAVRESGDSSVGSIHLNTRLLALADSLKGSPTAARETPRRTTVRRTA